MDRQAHDYAAAMAYAQQQQVANIQQQQSFGFHPPHQQFPPSVHGPPFLPPHPSPQQFPFHRHIQQPQLHPHHPPHPHLLHLPPQQQPPPSFPPHLPPHLVPSALHAPYDSPPPPSAPPPDPELQKRIDKLVEYAAKNGPEFEAMVRGNQQDNPALSFLFGGEGHNYYRYKLWISTRPPGGPYNSSFPSSSIPLMHPPNAMMNLSSLNASGAPQMHQPPFPPLYEQQHHQISQPFVDHSRPDYDQPSRPFKGLSGPLPSDVAMELNNVLNNLTGTKDSIKGAKMWFMQRSPFAPALAEALRERLFAMDDCESQWHIIYLANDILFDSLQRRLNPHDLDNEALAFKPVLGSMLARIYHNHQNKEENQSRLQQILQFWADKKVYDHDTIGGLENDMIGGPTASSFPGLAKELSTDFTDPSMAGLAHQAGNHNVHQWQPGQQSSLASLAGQEHPDKQILSLPSLSTQPFLQNSVPTGAFAGSMPNQQPTTHLLPTPAANSAEKLPPYPLFPPGLIPGMVRKMQIGSGVPYSPMSPLDIPTAIPPSTVSSTEILDRVSKFFKEIGEVNPSEGPMNGSKDEDDEEYERESPVRKGGACIPPPANLHVDPDTGMYPDGTVERKPGSSGSGRLGLGATANPNEASQYDDVYSSYRKQRSTNYHTSMSVRAATR